MINRLLVSLGFPLYLARKSSVMALLVGGVFLASCSLGFGASSLGDVTISGFEELPEGEYLYDNLTLNDGAWVFLAGGSTLTVTGRLHLTEYSSLFCLAKNRLEMVDGQWVGEGVVIQAKELVVDSGCFITADGEGYPGDQGDGDLGPGLGPQPGLVGGAYNQLGGAGHGGAGGSSCSDCSNGGGVYGSAETPTDLGSGGATTFVYMGDMQRNDRTAAGGGAIRIIAESMIVNGSISANGKHYNPIGPSDDWGGGAGGSLWITTNQIQGTGVVSVNGEDGYLDAESNSHVGPGGGGGGRLALYAWEPLGLNPEDVSVDGGMQFISNGDPSVGEGAIPSGQNGSVYRPLSNNEYAYGVFATGWALLDLDPSQTSSVFTVQFPGSTPQILAEGMPPVGHLLIDTTEFPDGEVWLEAVFTDEVTQNEYRYQRTLVVNNQFHHVGGVIMKDMIWSPDKVYIVEESLSLANGITLTVEPGTIVKFREGTTLNARGGILDAQGTASQPIIFTSIYDDSIGGDTNLDQNATVPCSADWNIHSNSLDHIVYNENTEFRYGVMPHGGGHLYGKQTWPNKFPHVLEENMYFHNAGASLTLEKGTVLKVGKSGFNIYEGEMLMQGTLDEPVIITSIHDDSVAGDTNRNGNETLPEPGDWYGIMNSGSLNISHSKISYGKNGISTRVFLTYGPPGQLIMENSSITQVFDTAISTKDSRDEDVDYANGEISVSLTNCIITNVNTAVNPTAGDISLMNCSLYNNRNGAILEGGRVDLVNTVIVNNDEFGVSIDDAQTTHTIHYSNVWGNGAQNYTGIDDPTGSNGNISQDPLMSIDPDVGYSLLNGSPLIDAADGLEAAHTDLLGKSRVDIPDAPNTGIPTIEGVYADIGAIEKQPTVQKDLDLAITAITLPDGLIVGGTGQIQYQVSNLGSETVVGTWDDRIEFYRTLPSGGEEVLEPVMNRCEGTIAPGENRNITAGFTVPHSSLNSYKARIMVNASYGIFEHANKLGNNRLESVESVPFTIDLHPPGDQLSGSLDPVVRAAEFGFSLIKPHEGVQIKFHGANQSNVMIYVRKNALPSLVAYDWMTPTGISENGYLDLGLLYPGDYYVLVSLQSNHDDPVDYIIDIEGAEIFTPAETTLWMLK